MPRVVKEYALRRAEILDAAQRLVYTKGYEQMAIQDILDELHIAKGTFFHYFSSKQALLQALIDRMMQEALVSIIPLVDDPALPALDKFHRFFDTIASWKAARKELLRPLLHVWYMDENAIVRQKMNAAGGQMVVPVLSGIIQQGCREGVLHTRYPDQAGEVTFALMLGLADSVAALMLSPEGGGEQLPRLAASIAAYTDALERTLGAPQGSLHLFDIEMLKEWL